MYFCINIHLYLVSTEILSKNLIQYDVYIVVLDTDFESAAANWTGLFKILEMFMLNARLAIAISEKQYL